MIIPENSYQPRLIDDVLRRNLTLFGAVSIEGPKWCGKTWSALHAAKSSFLLGEGRASINNAALCQMDTSIALAGETPHLIDEWQEIPALWDAVRFEIDKRGEKGQFLLTGSSTPTESGFQHSGAGRIKKLRMRTMSLFESGESSGQVSLRSLFDNAFQPCLCPPPDLKKLIYYTVRGGWPGALDIKEDATAPATQYLENLEELDFQKYGLKASEIKKAKRLLRSLARNESTTVSIAKLKTDMQEEEGRTLDEDTISRYLEILNRFHLIANQPAYDSKLRSSTRIKGMEKKHLTDPSLSAALLQATPEKLYQDLQTFGFLFEALCERDLAIYINALGGNLFHYQDYKNHEIDAIAELSDGRYGAFEIKLGENQVEEAAENLKKIMKQFENEGTRKPEFFCVLTGMSSAAYRRKDGIYVIPITALRN